MLLLNLVSAGLACRRFRAFLLSSLVIVFAPLAVADGSSPVKFDALYAAAPYALPEPKFLGAIDGTLLAYQQYTPAKPKAALVFYHDQGSYSAGGVQYLAVDLARQHGFLVITPDIRGHGDSGGPRGDTPKQLTVWQDVDIVLNHVRDNYPDLPLFIGGQGTGAGMLLNYLDYKPKAHFAGLIMVSPQLGPKAPNIDRVLSEPFVTPSKAGPIVNKMSLGLGCKHCAAETLNYPRRLVQRFPGTVTTYSVEMVKAITPTAPSVQLLSLRVPYSIFVGSKDELVNASRLNTYVKEYSMEPYFQGSTVLKGEGRISILMKGATPVGQWMDAQLKRQGLLAKR